MNDYYSNFPGPTRDEAIQIIKNKLILYETNDKEINLDLLIEQYIDEVIDKYKGLGSYTGWNVIVLPTIIKKLVIHLNLTK